MFEVGQLIERVTRYARDGRIINVRPGRVTKVTRAGWAYIDCGWQGEKFRADNGRIFIPKNAQAAYDIRIEPRR